METNTQIQTMQTGRDERIRIIKLEEFIPFKLSTGYYAKKLNRSHGAISQALNDYPKCKILLTRIVRHNNWLENKYVNKKKPSVQKDQLIESNGNTNV
jgi:hypothetical protein